MHFGVRFQRGQRHKDIAQRRAVRAQQRGRVFHIARGGATAPAQRQRLAVDERRALDAQFFPLRRHAALHKPRRIIPDQAVGAAVGRAAVGDVGGVLLRAKAQPRGFAVIKDRKDFAGLHVDLQRQRGVQQSGVIDIRLQQLRGQPARRGPGVCLVIKKHPHTVRVGGRLRSRPRAVRGAVNAGHGHIGRPSQPGVQPVGRRQAGQRQLRSLADRARVGFVAGKTAVPRIRRQPGPRQGGQDQHDRQRDHQLDQRKAPAGLQLSAQRQPLLLCFCPCAPGFSGFGGTPQIIRSPARFFNISAGKPRRFFKNTYNRSRFILQTVFSALPPAWSRLRARGQALLRAACACPASGVHGRPSARPGRARRSCGAAFCPP